MILRSKTKQSAKSAKMTRSETGTPATGRLGQSKKLDHGAADATVPPAASDPQIPGTSRECLPTGTSAEQVNVPLSCRSRASSSTRSSATIRARRLTAEAHLARKSIEREQELFQRELDNQRKLLEQFKQVEQLELEAKIAALEAEERSNHTKIRRVYITHSAGPPGRPSPLYSTPRQLPKISWQHSNVHLLVPK
ncbi:uncharacterized protein LOC133523445 [Cydia pomonella]|uniref:uncharacterized protein LOC133523445 n=1 Tax=Cydia pomonella TaxID=82600 RepID=UPI002ADD4469|nr:uncharacterized protein LOC133523445 [Cydia pomonella]